MEPEKRKGENMQSFAPMCGFTAAFLWSWGLEPEPRTP